MTAGMITYADLAELAEAMRLASAGHLRASAETEAAQGREDGLFALDKLDDVYGLIEEIPEPPFSTKHGDDCWRRHARCLADRIGEAL